MIKIKLKHLGDRTEARCSVSINGKSEQVFRWGRNGVEAATKVVLYIQKTYGRGHQYTIEGTPIKGKT